MAGRPKPFCHRRSRAKGWIIYGAQRAQPVATDGNRFGAHGEGRPPSCLRGGSSIAPQREANPENRSPPGLGSKANRLEVSFGAWRCLNSRKNSSTNWRILTMTVLETVALYYDAWQ